LDAKADLLVYGMGETQILEAARRLDFAAGKNQNADLSGIPGTVYAASSLPENWSGITLPSFEEIANDTKKFAASYKIQAMNTDPHQSLSLAESCGVGPSRRFVIQNTPVPPLSQAEFDRVYELPYVRNYHPSYEAAGGVPAIQEVKFSLIHSRGCFGACSFCSLNFHQGRIVCGRSGDSLVREAQTLIQDPEFKGYIHDVGGPTANFRTAACNTSANSSSDIFFKNLFCNNISRSISGSTKKYRVILESSDIVFNRS